MPVRCIFFERRKIMKRHLPKTMMIGLSFLLGVYLVMPIFQLTVPDTRAAQSEKSAAQMAPAEVDSRLAGMSDEQVRQAYGEKLKQDAAGGNESGQASEEEKSWSSVLRVFLPARARVPADGVLPSPK
jgi:hypothetical protein